MHGRALPSPNPSANPVGGEGHGLQGKKGSPRVAGTAARFRQATVGVRRLGLFAAALGLVLAAPGIAVADPSASPSPTPTATSPGAIEAQIDETWNKLEPLLEQWNGVHGQLVANQAKVAQLQ